MESVTSTPHQAVMRNASMPPVFRRIAESQFPFVIFDAYLERANRRYEDGIPIGFDEPPRFHREQRVIRDEPQQGARIEQDVHSNASGQSSGSSGFTGSSWKMIFRNSGCGFSGS